MSFQKCGKIDAESVKRAVAFIEQLFPVKTGAAFEEATGISSETFRKWRDGVSMPGWRHSLKMIVIFGPEFLAATLDNPPEWLGSAARAEMSRKLLADIEAKQRELKELSNF